MNNFESIKIKDGEIRRYENGRVDVRDAQGKVVPTTSNSSEIGGHTPTGAERMIAALQSFISAKVKADGKHADVKHLPYMNGINKITHTTISIAALQGLGFEIEPYTLTDNIFKQKRESAGLTQKEVAEKLQVAQPHISRWENGERNPNAKTRKELAVLYGCTVDELI